MIKIIIAGEGGQGVQVIAEILARSAFNQKLYSSYIPNFGVEQRGGVSLAYVVIDKKPINYPKFRCADILAVLSERSLKRVEKLKCPKTQLILGPAFLNCIKTDLPPKVWNILVLGMINKNERIVRNKYLQQAIMERFADKFIKNPQLKRLDFQALDLGSKNE